MVITFFTRGIKLRAFRAPPGGGNLPHARLIRWSHVFRAFALLSGASAWAVPQDVFTTFDSDAMPAWTLSAGQWRVAGGAIVATPRSATEPTFAFAAGDRETDFAVRCSVRLSDRAGVVFSATSADELCELALDRRGRAELTRKDRETRTTLGQGTFPGGGADAWVEVEIMRRGSATTVRINGACVFDRLAQPELRAGRVGWFAEGGPARFDNVSVTALPVELLADRFERADGRWHFQGGWTVRDGVLTSERGGLATVSHQAAELSYTCGLSVFLPAQGAATKAGAVFEYRDAQNYSSVVLTPGGTVVYAKVVAGKPAITARGEFAGAKTNLWHDVAILRTRDSTRVNVDGRRVLTVNEPGGADLVIDHIGLMAEAGAARFDDFVVTRGLDPYKKTFPKIGGVYIGGPRTLDREATQRAFARHDLVLMGLFQDFERGGKRPPELVREIKARNPALLVGNYACVMESYATTKDGQGTLIAKLDAEHGPAGAPAGQPNDWWLRNADGEKVGQYPRTKMTNLTYFVSPDADGFRYPQWYAGHTQRERHFGNTDLDFMFSDNGYAEPAMFAITPTPPDWNRDGRNDVSGDPGAVNFRYGMATFWMKFQQLNPARFVFGNIGGQRHSDPLGRPEYRELLGGALFEGWMGKTYSEETWAGWDLAMQSYRNLMDHTAAPHLVMNATRGTPTGEASDPKVRPNYPPGYAFMRCALASTLMEDGYFSYGGEAYNIEDAVWFDEFDLQLGHAIDPPQRKPWQEGVYFRRFQNGAALVNPRANGVRTVDLTGLGFRHFRGEQDPGTNNGQPVTTLRLEAGDGIVLVRD